MHTEQATLVETFVVQDVYVSGLHDIENLGEGDYRFTFYVKQRSTQDQMTDDRIVVARIVMSTSSILSGIQQTMRALGRSCCGAISRLQH